MLLSELNGKRNPFVWDGGFYLCHLHIAGLVQKTSGLSCGVVVVYGRLLSKGGRLASPLAMARPA